MSVITKSRQARCPQGFYQPARTQSIIQPCSTESGRESTVLLTPHLSRPKRRGGKCNCSHTKCQNTSDRIMAYIWNFSPTVLTLLWDKAETTTPDGKLHTCTCRPELISATKTKNIRQRTFFLWLRRDFDKQKLISDDKNYDETTINKTLTRRD